MTPLRLTVRNDTHTSESGLLYSSALAKIWRASAANSSLEVTIWVSMRRWSVPKSMGFLTMSK